MSDDRFIMSADRMSRALDHAVNIGTGIVCDELNITDHETKMRVHSIIRIRLINLMDREYTTKEATKLLNQLILELRNPND